MLRSQDLFSRFGLAETPEFSDEGNLDAELLPATDLKQKLLQWRTTFGVATTNGT